ncbi:Dit1p NDAI_0A04240 [Naumovozyma dairenensis CBS 421]|uniref:Spore wall maturation protein DIT1 n=1 Tax=Naumovozyma dairenensis (strain ATCC 10597 / BCRC 20456 / CBS 421 / NBRC 0211 / NRRL Y-12639) TaxID=1071378 RepID=G0W443_NAUDC|nr:hypothetical protein NDAI_0A04240 [Naumovozyma dairenensis CBS 421]CCD22581.1 hypothetical protein NDAI_0A04240 [Naumovozyma dairenensis CBS 421]
MTISEDVCNKSEILASAHNKAEHKADLQVANTNAAAGEADLSTYGKFIALYSRDSQTNQLYCIQEKGRSQIAFYWSQFVDDLYAAETRLGSQSGKVIEYIIPQEIADKWTNGLGLPVKISEYQKDNEIQTRGCVTAIGKENSFNDWFIFHILDHARLQNNDKLIVENKSGPKYDEAFAEFFAANLKNAVKDDQWEVNGRDYFLNKVRYFTDRMLKIECVLPAFPCKSSNGDKVHSTVPDKGEELALRRLIKAAEQFSEIYPPGLKFWIVSDGHVFSDCIGVDDDIVTHYTHKLHELYANIATPGTDYIGFCGLNDIFFDGVTQELFNSKWVEDVKIEHYTGSKICPTSDLSRQILMKACDTDDGHLRRDIATDGHPRLHLYRGFSRFMMEDLKMLSHFKDSSRKGFKKTISKIAFNMIRRNDAYSNLVELIFPHHMRLSIHAHTNSGPKFGIKVISSDQCKIIKTFDGFEEEPKFEDLLHIPTPWHNCVVKVKGSESTRAQFYLTKSKVIKEAMDNGMFDGGWKGTVFEKGEGGHFVVQRRPSPDDTSTTNETNE